MSVIYRHYILFVKKDKAICNYYISIDMHYCVGRFQIIFGQLFKLEHG